MSTRGKCNSPLCRARESMTKYLNNFLDTHDLGDVCKERNSNMDLVRLVSGAQVKVYVIGSDKRVWKKQERLIAPDLSEVLYDLCDE